jgi:antitoxin (DNA-binding transcriptional repressor) of toxin-antitoxin stability system
MGVAKVMPVRRHGLGAEELIEMGRSGDVSRPDRRPFLSGRSRRNSLGAEELIEMGAGRRVSLGDIVDLTGNAAPYLATVLAITLDTLSDLGGSSLDVLAQGADVARNRFSDLVQKVPALADIYAEILLAGGALARFGLSVPGLSVRALGNILAGIAGALSDLRGDNQARIDKALKMMVDLAPDEIKADVKTVLESSGVTGDDLAPRVDLDTGVVTPDTTPSGAQG